MKFELLKEELPKGTPLFKKSTVEVKAQYHGNGYEVYFWVDGEPILFDRFGNYKYDSKTVVKEDGLSIETLKQLAGKTVSEIAGRYEVLDGGAVERIPKMRKIPRKNALSTIRFKELLIEAGRFEPEVDVIARYAVRVHDDEDMDITLVSSDKGILKVQLIQLYIDCGNKSSVIQDLSSKLQGLTLEQVIWLMKEDLETVEIDEIGY